ncbi:MAG: ABC transporter permease [Myxococcales bacterium]|nr:ABC transporter permease [Myxococcales bacterium]
MGTQAIRFVGYIFGAALLGLLALPVTSLVGAISVQKFLAGVYHPLFWPAISLSLRTTILSIGFVVLLGTPLAWWMAHQTSRIGRLTTVVVHLPIIMPPAVVGVALLQAFGRKGWFGTLLSAQGLNVSFTVAAVVIAQMTVAAPFYVQASIQAFKKISPDVWVVARSLGASPIEVFLRVGVPMAIPGLISGVLLAWARALGEFGATLVFAGNRVGHTQTLPLAIFYALESDIELALVFSLILVLVGLVVILVISQW